jgi:hypothetical protein
VDLVFDCNRYACPVVIVRPGVYSLVEPPHQSVPDNFVGAMIVWMTTRTVAVLVMMMDMWCLSTMTQQQ